MVGNGTQLPPPRCYGDMDHPNSQARHLLKLAEAELAVIKQELAIQKLAEMGQPTAEAVMLLQRFRQAALDLTYGSARANGALPERRAAIDDAA
jgi:hypothetical protein